MGVSKGSSPPPAPDAGFLTQQQGKSNIQSAINQQRLNAVNQVTPFGSVTYAEDGGWHDWDGNWIPQFKATTTLAPDQQKLSDTQTRVSQGMMDLGEGYIGKIGEATGQPFSYDGVPRAPNAPDLPAVPTAGPMPTYNDAYRADVLGKILQRNQPQMDRDREALTSKLANQGIGLETRASDRAWDNYNRGVNDFRLGADVAAGADAAQRFGLELAAQNQDFGQKGTIFGLGMNRAQTGFGNEGAVRDRAIADALRLRTQPINEASAIFGLSGGVQVPQFVGTPQTGVQGTDVMSPYMANYQGQLQNYQTQQQANNALMGSIFGLGGTLGGAALLGPFGAAAGGALGSMMGGGGVSPIRLVGRSVSYD